MQIILLSGPTNCGKTTTLNMVYAQLVQGQQNPPPKKPLSGKPLHIVDHNAQSIPISVLHKDFGCELTYKNKKVAIYSMGDYIWRTYRAIIDYCNRVDVLIIAHNFANTQNKVYLESSIAAYPYHHVIKKTTSNNQVNWQASNQADCQAIISKI